MPCIMKTWDIVDKIKLINNCILISQGKKNACSVLLEHITNNYTKNYIKFLFGIR